MRKYDLIKNISSKNAVPSKGICKCWMNKAKHTLIS